ncbi:MAG: Uncharacterised protein [Synechococcus sp. MIT S9220]|nr:MAG: Uncharacterised protein [Synechococcus sp. MIT S9220]
MNLFIRASRQHGGSHSKDSFRRGRTQGAVKFCSGELRLSAITTPAGQAGLQGSQSFLERLLETASDGHGFTHRFHGRGEHCRRAPKFFKGEAWNLGDDVINRRFKAGGCFAGDVVENLVEGVANSETRSNFGNGESSGLAGQSRRSADAGIHLDDHHLAIGGVDRELDVAASSGHPDLANNGDGLIPQSLVLAVREGLGWGHGDRITGVNSHGIEVFDAANNHHVVGEIAHHLQFKFLPTQQRLFDQNLRDGTGIKSGFAD